MRYEADTNGMDGKPNGARGVHLPARFDSAVVAGHADNYGYGTGTYLPPASRDDDVDLVKLVRLLIVIAIKWRYLVVSCAGTFFAIGLAYWFLATPLYSATVRIQIDREAGKIIEGGATGPSELVSNDFQRTQHELLKSRGIAERTVATVGADKWHLEGEAKRGLWSTVSSAFRSSGEQVDETQLEKIKNELVKTVRANVEIRPVPNSRLVDIIYTDPSPARAAKVANAYADSYIAANLDKRFEASAYAKVFLDDQIKQLKLRLEEAEKALIDFAERENMVQTNDRVSIAESNLAAANAAQGLLVSARIRDEQSWKQVERANAINLPQFLTNSVIDGLRAQRNALKRDYEEKLETFKPSYPEMVQISKKIAELDRQQAAEVNAIRSSLRAAYEASLAQEEHMRGRIEELRADVLELQKKSVRYGILQREAESTRNLYNNLLQRYKEVDVASGVGTNNVFMVDRALPGTKTHPRTLLVLAGSIMLGLIAGFSGAVLIELFDDRVRTAEDLEKLTGLPVLGLVPRSTMDEGLMPELAEPRSGLAEAYRSLATSMQFATDTGLPRSLVITSGGQSEGKSSTAIALARHYAITGKRVLLVDADMRRPSLHAKLGLQNGAGLSNALTGMATISDVVQQTGIENLWLITSGPLPPNAAELLGGTQIFSFIAIALESFDLIIFDSPPLLGLADAQLLGAAAQATIFIAASGEARRGVVRNALRRLYMARALTIGAVLTMFDARSVNYDYGYGMDYGYYGASDDLPTESATLPQRMREKLGLSPPRAA